MPSKDLPRTGLLPSILDRLIDPQAGIGRNRSYSLEQLLGAVRRDVEDLLNTNLRASGVPEEFVEVRNSVASFGLPDMTALGASTPQERLVLGELIEEAIARFEPRLKEVRVSLKDNDKSLPRSIKFHIDARLALEPAPRVAFETTLELTTRRTTIDAGEVIS